MEAKDIDSGRNGEISYQILSTQPHAEPPLLSIDPISGRLSLIRAVPSDWTGRRLVARIRATDGGQRFADTEVAVQLAARLGPRFTSTHYVAVVSENASVGESVASVMAISASGTTLLYRIVSIGPDHAESSVQECPFHLDYETGACIIHFPYLHHFTITPTFAIKGSSSLSSDLWICVSLENISPSIHVLSATE